jgi:hypothetical protein
MLRPSCIALLFATAAFPVHAQQADEEIGETVVTAQMPRGVVLGNSPPEVTLNAGDIRSFGATNVADLLSQIAPQTGSGGRGEGQPVVLLNGKRISGFGEVRDLPSEAIVRVEVFPPEVALRYGYRATQKVVNLILRERFSAVRTEVSGLTSTEPGRLSGRAEAGLLRIRKDQRTSLDAKFEHFSPLTESERDIALTGTPDARPYRTLMPRTNTGSLNGTLSRSVLGNVAASLNGRVEATDSRAGLGLDVARPLVRDSNGVTGHAGLTLNSALGAWQWTVTANADLGRSESLTDRTGRSDRDRAVSNTRSADLDAVFSGSLFKLPAGEAVASVGLGGEAERIASRSVRAGVAQASRLSRSTGRGQANIDLPIANRARAVLRPLGKLSINANAALDDVSNFGTLKTYGYGLAWTPVSGLDITASVSHEDNAPSIQQLGNPVQATPDVRVFDYLRGETSFVTRTDGGNAALGAEKARINRLSITAKPFTGTDLSLTANWTDTRAGRAILSFPTATAALEAAYPARFVRDGTGRLVSVDMRPVNVEETRQQTLRWGVNFSKRLGPAPQGNPLDAMRGPGGPGGPPRGAGAPGSGPPRGGFGGGGFGRQPRIQFALYHSWQLRDDVMLAAGLPRLDLLDGDAIGNSGGVSRHRIEAQGGVSKNGLGMRFSANWQNGTSVRGVSDTLHFGSLTTVDLRLFANLGLYKNMGRTHPWLRGAQVFIGVNNIFNAKQDVRTSAGLVPSGYVPDQMDAQGRTVRITFRKLFMSFRPRS